MRKIKFFPFFFFLFCFWSERYEKERDVEVLGGKREREREK